MVCMVEGGDTMRQASSYKPKLNSHFLDHLQDPNEIDTVFYPDANLQPAGASMVLTKLLRILYDALHAMADVHAPPFNAGTWKRYAKQLKDTHTHKTTLEIYPLEDGPRQHWRGGAEKQTLRPRNVSG